MTEVSPYSAPTPGAYASVRAAFHDSRLQQQFDRDGFVVVPFIDRDRRDQLLDLCAALDSGISSGFYTSMHARAPGYKVAAHEGLERICSDLPARYLLDYRLIFGTFAVKLPGPDGAVAVHQDLSLADETRFAGVNCWVPVTEVTAENGPLMVMKGSHHLFPKVRGMHQALFKVEGLREAIVDRYLTRVDVSPGEAVLTNTRLVHYSPPNMGERPRVAVILGMIPREAASQFCYTHPDGEMELFEVAPDFFYRCDQLVRPSEGTSLGRVQQEACAITDMERFYSLHPELR